MVPKQTVDHSAPSAATAKISTSEGTAQIAATDASPGHIQELRETDSKGAQQHTQSSVNQQAGAGQSARSSEASEAPERGPKEPPNAASLARSDIKRLREENMVEAAVKTHLAHENLVAGNTPNPPTHCHVWLHNTR